ncbi:MAG: polysulfide reductase NrfD [Planctomycetes bacterium]|nr:polysulfide reductase NrfD [Planctomycetota bacterium]
MRYGFVIDNRVCIGCHACTVACKAEHLVPIGVNRTWVKYIERGNYPNVSRNFQVTRCNHCKDAPCVTICPTTALFHRADGIVDFDNRRCIGCKSCTQACPYDALYIDPNTHTAAKCNFCAHRIDQGLNPSCVNICPEQAIHFGDVEDPNSDVSRLIAKQPATVRKPEKGTGPQVYYIEGDQAALNPSATSVPETTVWSDQTRGVGHHAGADAKQFDLIGIVRKAQATRAEAPAEQLDGLLRELEKASGGEKVRRAYDAPDKGVQWGWEVAAYIMTKAIAAGCALMTALAYILPQLGIGPKGAPVSGLYTLGLPITALVFLAITGALLIKDLDQPKRFLYVLLRPHWTSWLVRGAYIVTAFGAILTAWIVVHALGLRQVLPWLAWPMAGLALAASVYTAFLFGQCKGRDFWQSPALIVHMFVHAPLAGFGVLCLIGQDGRIGLGISLVVSLAVIFAEVFGKHATQDASATAKDMRTGRAAKWFYGGVIAVGHIAPLGLLALGKTGAVFAAIAMFLGMAVTEYLWVYLPQKRSNT